MKSKLIICITTGCFIIGSIIPVFSAEAPTTELRAAIDIGSGATRIKIAKVDPKTQKIASIIFSKDLNVPYQAHLSKSSNETFDNDIKAIGLESLQHLKEVADHYGVKKVVAVATSAFRNAKNAPEYSQHLEAIAGIPVNIINQDLEGILAFDAAAANVPFRPETMVVWDIGGGSVQFTTLADGQHHVYKGNVASIGFKDLIIKEVQGKNTADITSPNPMTQDEIERAIAQAEKVALNVDELIKSKITEQGTHILGVGSVFAYGIGDLVEQNPVTQCALRAKVLAMKDKDDVALGNNPFSSVALSNAILVLGMMQALDIESIVIEEVNNTDGALVYGKFWEKTKR